MISPTTNPALFTSGTTTNPLTGATPKTTLDKDAFLKLFITQLKNQDPSSPLQPHEMAAQLAQFTSVEQLTKLNDGMNAQAAALQADTLVGQAALSASTIGRDVIAGGDQVTIPSHGNGRIHFDVGGNGGNATLTIKDNNGSVLATRQLGTISSGTHDYTLPANLPAGDWHYSVSVTGSDQKPATVTTYTIGTVTGLSFSGGKLSLKIGSLVVPFEDIAEILPTGGGSTVPLPSYTPPSTSPSNPPNPGWSPSDDGSGIADRRH